MRTLLRKTAVLLMAAVLAAGCGGNQQQVEEEFLGRINDVYGPSDAGDQQTLLQQGKLSCDFATAREFQDASQLAFSEREATLIFDLARSTGLCDD